MKGVEEAVERSPGASPHPEQLRRKRLGQYFSGHRLAKLLAAFADADSASQTLDPMVGVGDMLHAVRQLSPDGRLLGIEIDPDVADRGRRTLRTLGAADAAVVTGDAFAWSTLSQLPTQDFDLVITNPPYVRYQSTAVQNGQHYDMPSARHIRTSLLESLGQLPDLNPRDRHILMSLTRAYSGLSDLAVPSWLLCAALTRVGGVLAMVVPESWLSREYAKPIQYMLTRLFTLEYVVEDLHRAWFADAQVKTMLVIARRKPAVDRSMQADADSTYIHLGIPNQIADERSLVGGLFSSSGHPERAFVAAVKDEAGRSRLRDRGVSIQDRAHRDLIRDVSTNSATAKWLRNLEPVSVSDHLHANQDQLDEPSIPADLVSHIPTLRGISTVGLRTLGINLGQGLRTGANSFFYVELVHDGPKTCEIEVSRALGSGQFTVPTSALSVVLRRQHELPNGWQLQPSQLRGRVLVLNDWVHPLDATEASSSMRQLMPSDLARLVTSSSQVNVGTAEAPRFIPSLSAVRTNVSSRAGREGSSSARFWYMLPRFQPRHLPDLFVARLHSNSPRFFLNSDEKTVIDANFSTVWLTGAARVTIHEVFALLNSSWVQACLEALGAVMGGGALKLEAAHLRRLPLPELDAVACSELDGLGKQLLALGDDEAVRQQIDRLVASSLVGEQRANALVKSLRGYLIAKQQHRAARV